MGQSQKSLADKIREAAKNRLALVIIFCGALAFVATAITNSKTIIEFFQGPSISAFSVPADQRENELVKELSMSAPFPLGWQVEASEVGETLRQGGDDYMAFSVGSLQDIDVNSLPEAWESRVNEPLVRTKKVDALMPLDGQLKISSVGGFLFEYDASDGSDRRRLEMVAHHDGKAIFARCSIVKRAVDAYRSGCMELLDNVTLLAPGKHAPVMKFTTEVASARIWQSTPLVFNESYDYLVSNWSAFDPGVPHSIDGSKLTSSQFITSDQVVEQWSTLAGRPIKFSAMIDAAEKLTPTEGGGMRWLLQLTSNQPGTRFYVQVNAPADSKFTRGDLAVVIDAVLVAGGPTLVTNGGLDNSLYFLAQYFEAGPPIGPRKG